MAKINVLVDSDSDGKITDVQAYPTNFEGEADINLDISQNLQGEVSRFKNI